MSKLLYQETRFHVNIHSKKGNCVRSSSRGQVVFVIVICQWRLGYRVFESVRHVCVYIPILAVTLLLWRIPLIVCDYFVRTIRNFFTMYKFAFFWKRNGKIPSMQSIQSQYTA